MTGSLMRLKIIAVGRLKSGPEHELVLLYADRLKTSPARLGPLTVHEIDERKDARKILEAQQEAVSGLAPGARAVALDETGENLTTRALADRLAKWRDDSAPETAFLIGAA